MQKSRELIRVTDLAVGYDSAVLRGVNLSLCEGGRLLLDGPSGCGKSSLLRALIGLPTPAEGQVVLFGQRLDAASAWSLRRQTGYVPQEPDLGSERVRDFLERVLSFHANRFVHPTEGELSDLMSRWLLPSGLLEKSCADLSGGEKQRVAILPAMLLRRKLLLLDEPTSALDKASREVLYDWIGRSADCSFVIVSHDAGLRELADETIDLSLSSAEAGHGR